MKQTTRLLLSFLILSTMFSYAQENKLKKANKKFNDFAYIDATKVYLEVVKSGFESSELYKKLGDSYYFNANYEEAAKTYTKLFVLNENVKPVYFLRYSQCLKAIGKDEESIIWFDKYAAKANLSGKEFENAEDYLQIINENSNRYTLQPVSINTDGIDFGAGFKNKETYTYTKLVIASTNSSKKASSRNRNAWDGLSFLDLYEVDLNEDGSIGEKVKLEGDVNTKQHESSAVFTKDGKTMYFTRNNTSPRTKRGRKETQYLKIYRAHLVNGLWTNVEDLTINGDNYSTAHPALNITGDKLYFVSDMPQTLGQTDIFSVTIHNDGTLGKPVNLGEKVNTKGRESFPFVTKDNELYFSSDGHFGLGGYDVFYLQIKGGGYSGSLLNVGKPINSAFDDFAFVIDNHKGFVSSNRMGGKGYDDIYSFIEHKDIKDLSIKTISGTVKDNDSQLPIANATITIVDEDNSIITTLQTDETGQYYTELKPDNYIIKVTKEGYEGNDKFSKKNNLNEIDTFELSKNVFKATEGEDIAKLLNIIIYFDYNASIIRLDAKVELEKVIAVLKQNPTIKLDIRSHTDSRGDDTYNMTLSQKRNVATLQYIIEQGGISPNRLTGKGYGETQLVNACVNGIECSEEMQQANRRSEFIIIN